MLVDTEQAVQVGDARLWFKEGGAATPRGPARANAGTNQWGGISTICTLSLIVKVDDRLPAKVRFDTPPLSSRL